MNKRNVLIIIGVILLIIVVVILLSYLFGTKTETSPSTTASLFESIRNSVNQHLSS